LLVATALPWALVGAIAALLAAALIGRRLVAPAGGSRGLAATAGVAGVLLLAVAGVDRSSLGGQAALEASLRESYQASWRELDDATRAVATALAALPTDDAARDARFGALAGSLSHLRPFQPSVLIFDGFGDLDCWWGPGLSPDAPRASRSASGPGIYRSALATTAYVGRSVRQGGTTWHVVAARSYSADGPPPVRAAERGRWSVARWALLPAAESGGLPSLVLDSPVVRLPSPIVSRLRSAARLAAAALLAALGVLLGVSPSLRAGRSPAGVGCRVVPLLAVAATLGAWTLGASPLAATCLFVAVLSLAVLLVPDPRRATPLVWRAAAVACGAALAPLLAAGLPFQVVGRLTEELALFDGTRAAQRLTLALLLFAGWWLATGWGGARSGRGRQPAWIVAGLAAGCAPLAIDRPLVGTTLLAVTGAAATFAAGRDRRWGTVLGLAALALWSAAAAATLRERRAQADRDTAVLATALPPSAEQVAALGSAIESRLDETLAEGSSLTWRPFDEVSDLAFALWRDSPLARRDLLSAISVVAPDGVTSSFAAGVPTDPSGHLDLRPTRWSGRVPEAWLNRRIGGERSRRDASGGAWVTRWLAVPRPGFDAGDEEERGALREIRRPGEAGDVFSERDSDLRIVLYDERGRVIESPWIEDTPELDAAWAAAKPFALRAPTPDGTARIAVATGGGVVAVAFLLATTPALAIERAASYIAGAAIPVLLLAVPALLLALPRRRIGEQLEHAWYSYSRRLVLVFTLVLLVPVVIGATWITHSHATRLAREQSVAAVDSLRSAQRILGEYVLSLEPGFGVGTALDDRLLEWLARVVRSEVHLYWDSELYASSKRDLFEAGIVPTRLSGDIWERIHGRHERVVRRLVPSVGGEYVEIYAPLEIPGTAPDATKLVLALPRLAQQEELALEIAGTRRRAFLATLALAVLLVTVGTLLARRFARPIEEIVRGTARIAEGASGLGYTPHEVDLGALATAIDQMAVRIAEARARLVVEKDLAERIAENVTAAVVGLDRDGRVVFANRLARTLLGAGPGEMFRERLRDAELSSAARAFDRAVETAEPVATRLELAGESRDWTLVRAPLAGPGEPSELVVVEDVTDVVRAQRLDAWAAMARIIAHEVKNPLTPIRLSTEHLREAWQRDREHFENVFERCTVNILRQVEELRRTANEFSLYSEIPRIEPREDDLAAAVEEVAEAYRAAPPSGIEVVLRRPANGMPASFDRRLLGRAVRNLIENAVRAAGSAGRVEIELSSTADRHCVRVSDDGPGVPDDLLSRLAEPYFSTQAGGTGLGLPIAKRIAEEHGGSLSLRNRPSGGFEATITIPRA